MKKIAYFIPFWGTSLIAGLILSVMAPYGTHQFSLIYRLVFWIGLCLAGGVGAKSAQVLIDKKSIAKRPLLRVFIQSLGATLCVWLCFLGLNASLGYTLTPEFFYLTPFYIWLIGVIICGFGELIHRRDAPPNKATTRPALFERLKPALRNADIYALSAEDHYVRVHTDRGDDLILMRLSDAVKETHPLRGLITHRSWWVAEAGVRKCEKAEGKLVIVLRNDVFVPVSRSNTKNVRDAGWV